MKKIINICSIALVVAIVSSCSKTELKEIDNKANTAAYKRGELTQISPNDQLRDRIALVPAFYNSKVFNLQMRQFTGPAALELMAQAPVVYNLYIYDPTATATTGKTYKAVTNAIRSETGGTVIWREFVIKFNRGALIQQFTSEEHLLRVVHDNPLAIGLGESSRAYEGGLLQFDRQFPNEGMIETTIGLTR